MAENGRISYSVGLDNSKLRNDATETKRILQGVGTTAAEEGQKMDDAFKKVGTAIAGVMTATAAVGFAKKIMDVRAEVQSLEISFKTLLGSEPKAKAFMDEIRQFAVETPLLLKDLATGAQTMLGFGLAADDIMPMLKAIGDVSMGDAQKFQSLTLAFSQATSAGKLMGQDLLQMINAGFNPLAQIAETTGKSIGQLKDEMSKGAISADMLRQAFIDATSEGGKFYGMLESQSKGIKGALSNLQGAFDDMYNELGEKMQEPFVKGVELATTLVKHYEEIGKTLLVLISAYGAYKAALIAVAAYQKASVVWGEVQAFMSLAKTIRTAKDAMIALNIATKANPVGLVLGVIAAAASAFALFKKDADNATESMKAQQEEIENFNKQIGTQAGRMQAAYKKLQKEYKDCKTAHEKRQWIKNSQQKFKELGLAVTDVNTAENIFVKNTKVMLEAFKKRAEATAWQSKVEQEYAKRVERQLYLEGKAAGIKAGSECTGYSHDATTGDEYVDRSGKWVYTEQGAEKARQNILQNDATLSTIDANIDKYTAHVAALNNEMEGLYTTAGNEPESTQNTETDKDKEKKEEEAQKLADEQAKRDDQIKKNAEEEKKVYEQTELDKRQAKISMMEEGYQKELAQNQLNYDRMIAENKKREEDMLKNLEDTMVLQWKNRNPKATEKQEIEYRQSLVLTAKDLTPEQQGQLKEFARIAGEIHETENQKSLDKMLQDVQTYEQKREAIEKDFAARREQIEYKHDENGKRTGKREGVEGNLAELDRQRDDALASVDEEFAEREETYLAWLDRIAGMTLEQLNNVLEQAKTELEKAQKEGKGGQELATAKAKVANTQNAIQKAAAKNDLSPKKRTLKDWKELYDVLQEGVRGFEEVGAAVGGTTGEIMKSAGEITSGTLSMINGIMTLVQNSAEGMTAAANVGAQAMSTVEKASVILAVISAALQVATAIANLFNHDDDKQEEIEALQDRIDELQWELDNADIMELRKQGIEDLQLVRDIIEETRMELAKEKLAVGDVYGAIMELSIGAGNNHKLLQQSAEKLATAYANVAYSANKALGEKKYDTARENLENLAQQQILIQEQIDKEASKKKSDSGAIKEMEQKIEELGAQAIELINGIVEEIIGGTSSDIASQLGDAFFDAFKNGEDAAEAWGNKVNDIVGDILKRMMVQKFLEEPLGDIFDKYKKKWFPSGQFAGIDAVIGSLQGFASDLNGVGKDFQEIWDALPAELKGMFNVADTAREASEKGIATASQESVDELNGRMTAVQGHTYSIMESTQLLVANTNAILARVMSIDNNTEDIAGRVSSMEGTVKEMNETINDIALKGIKMK